MTTKIRKLQTGPTISKIDVVAPGVNDDASAGFEPSSFWYDSIAKILYICSDATIGAAVWDVVTTPSSGGGQGGGAVALLLEENISAGDTVGYASHINNAAAKAVWAQRLASAIQVVNISSIKAVCRIINDDYAIIVESGGNYQAIIGTFNHATMTWSFGALSANFNNDFAGNLDVVRLDTNKFGVASFDSVTNPYTIRFTVFTIGVGNAITVGGNDTFSEPSTDNANNVQLVQLGVDRAAMVVGGTQAGSHCDLFEVTISGTTPTIGSQEILDSSTTAISGIALIGADKVAVVNDTNIWIATVAAGVWTVGAPGVLAQSTGVDTQLFGILSNATDTVYVSTGNVTVEYFTVSGTTPTSAAVASFAGTSTQMTLASDQTDIFLITQSPVVGENGSARLSVVGPDVIISEFIPFDINDQGGVREMFANQIMDGSNYYGVCQYNGPILNAIEFLFHIQGMTPYFIGIAAVSGTRGSIIPIITGGVAGNQVGLTPGAIYDPLEGGLIAATITTQFTMEAQSATEILVFGGGDTGNDFTVTNDEFVTDWYTTQLLAPFPGSASDESPWLGTVPVNSQTANGSQNSTNGAMLTYLQSGFQNLTLGIPDDILRFNNYNLIRLKWLAVAVDSGTQDYGFMGFTELTAVSTNDGDIADVSARFGFLFDAGTGRLYAVSADGVAITTVDIAPYDDLNHSYQIIAEEGVSIKFYMDNALVATIQTNLPTSGNQITLEFTGFDGGGAGVGFSFISHLVYSQKLN